MIYVALLNTDDFDFTAMASSVEAAIDALHQAVDMHLDAMCHMDASATQWIDRFGVDVFDPVPGEVTAPVCLRNGCLWYNPSLG